MRKVLLSLLACFVLVSVSMATETYKLNDNQVDLLFNGATEISITGINNEEFALSNMGTTVQADDTQMLIAWVVCWFVGEFGVHRYVLGTKPSMWAIYTFTCFGIFGIVPFVDFWVLLINGVVMKKGDAYLNNEKFFMWA
jgi:hypothetical protein